MKKIIDRIGLWRAGLVFLFVLGGTLRLIDSTDPPLDFHPTRQLRNHLVARAIYYDLHVEPGSEKRSLADAFRQSVGTYEPPIMETLVGTTFLATGESFIIPRIYQTVFWLLAGLCLFDLARRISTIPAALLCLTYYLILPFSVQASRSFQPDPLMTTSFVCGLYFLYRWSEESRNNTRVIPGSRELWKWAILSGLFLGFAALVKIVIAFLIAGAVLAVIFYTLGTRFWKSPLVWVMAGLMILPAFGYYVIGIPGRSTEYIFAWTITLIKLILTPDFYSKWLAFLGSLFGLTVLLLSLMGALLAQPRARAMLLGIWIGYFLYGLTLPFQMYTHSYYHVQIIPLVALGLAPVLAALVGMVSTQPSFIRALLAALTIAVIGYFSWVDRSVLIAEDFRHEPVFWSQVGSAIPPDGNVIALTQDYGYRLMFWGWRKVSLWPISTDLVGARGGSLNASEDFTDLTSGKDYFLVTAFGQLDKQPDLKVILQSYPVSAQGDGYILYDLRP